MHLDRRLTQGCCKVSYHHGKRRIAGMEEKHTCSRHRSTWSILFPWRDPQFPGVSATWGWYVRGGGGNRSQAVQSVANHSLIDLSDLTVPPLIGSPRLSIACNEIKVNTDCPLYVTWLVCAGGLPVRDTCCLHIGQLNLSSFQWLHIVVSYFTEIALYSSGPSRQLQL